MPPNEYERFARLGVATVHEASGGRGLVEADLIQVVSGARAAGPARTVLCGQDDNLAVHRAIERVEPGDVVVLAMPEARPVALIGELLVLQLQARHAAAVLVDAAVRDRDELARIALPVWARWIRAAGTMKRDPGEIDSPVTVGGARVHPGDIVVLDSDGAVVVAQARCRETLDAAEAREHKEAAVRPRLIAGELTADIYGLR